MWYFTWLLGVLFASALAILNVMWLEINVMSDEAEAEAEEKEGHPND